MIDADLLGTKDLVDFLDFEENRSGEARVVLTPHPKEFLALLKNAGLCKNETTVSDVVQKKLDFALSFVQKYKKCVLIAKGAIHLIALWKNGICTAYFNPLGKSSLAKGGSGDVLSGLVSSLLAQGWSALDSAISASLAHALSSAKIECNDYAMSPFSLIAAIKNLDLSESQQ